MTSVLRQMDPDVAAKDMLDSLGLPDRGPLHRMDKAAVIAQANAKIVADGGTPLSPLAAGSFGQAMAYLSSQSSGSARPDWVPADAVIHIDLVRAFNEQDAAWTAADGVVAVDTLLGADANTENAWGVSEYLPEQLTADGYVPLTNFPAFIGSARTKLLDSATLRVQTKGTEDSDAFLAVALVSADGNDAIEIDTEVGISDRFGKIYAWGGDLQIETAVVTNQGVGAINTLAATITASRADIAVNGSDAVSGVVGADDRPPGNPLVAALVSPNLDRTAIQTITLYDALPSTDGLSELSETGVVNTAPTEIQTGVEGGWSLDEAALTVTAETVDGYSYPVNASVVFKGVDPEGNPLIWSIIGDESGKLSIDTSSVNEIGGVIGNCLRLSGNITSDSPITFTLRATDPGGLYVEQEFTITVTA